MIKASSLPYGSDERRVDFDKSERLELDSGHDEHGLYTLMSLAVDGG